MRKCSTTSKPGHYKKWTRINKLSVFGKKAQRKNSDHAKAKLQENGEYVKIGIYGNYINARAL